MVQEPGWKKAIIEARPEPCRGPWWSGKGHGQTVLPYLLHSPGPEKPGRLVEIPLPDGDQLAARLHEGERGGVAVYFFHGLAGSIESGYMRRARKLAEDRGWHALAVNHRGCGEGLGLAKHPYHSGRGEDIGEAIRWGRANIPAAHHIAVGFSLSGNALLLLQAGYRGDTPPDFAIAVNAPIQLAKAAA
jgi:hypothetical protein